MARPASTRRVLATHLHIGVRTILGMTLCCQRGFAGAARGTWGSQLSAERSAWCSSCRGFSCLTRTRARSIMTVTRAAQDAGIWVFGYGSLVHNPGYKYSASVEGYIRGWRRVFHQGSTDHRGVPEAPGRTVTLEAAPGAVTWGVAYRLAGDQQEQQRTLAYLEWREKQYDLRVHVDVYSRHHPEVPVVRGALTYVATSDRSRNPNYLGPAAEEEIAHQIATSHGPSGPNYEYLFRLADAMRQMSVVDEELFRLEVLVRQRMAALGLSAAEVAAASDVVAAAKVAAAAAGLPLGMAGPEAAAAAAATVQAAACAAAKLESLSETLGPEGVAGAAAARRVEGQAETGELR